MSKTAWAIFGLVVTPTRLIHRLRAEGAAPGMREEKIASCSGAVKNITAIMSLWFIGLAIADPA